MLKRILITGADGQVGSELRGCLGVDAEIISLTRHNCDLAQSSKLDEIVRSLKPTAIINAAAYTAVDRAESEPDLALLINGTAPKILATVAKDLDIPFVNISTDYVFNGQNFTPYLETDLTNPVSVYGRTKLAGEQALVEVGGRYLNLRTAWVYGCHGKGNFVKTMLRLGETREEISVVADQIGTPTWAKTIAVTIGELLPKFTDHQLEAGTYHLTNSGVASWYDLAISVFDEARKLGFPLIVKSVVPITTNDYPTPATRPAYSVLSNRKLNGVLNHPLPHWRHDLITMLQELKSLK